MIPRVIPSLSLVIPRCHTPGGLLSTAQVPPPVPLVHSLSTACGELLAYLSTAPLWMLSALDPHPGDKCCGYVESALRPFQGPLRGRWKSRTLTSPRLWKTDIHRLSTALPRGVSVN